MNFKENTPIFLQVANRICDEILSGKLQENERILSVREYSALIEVNVNTIMRSFEYLQQQDIIFNKRGIGYFVNQGATKQIKDIRYQEFVEKDIPEFIHKMKTLNVLPDEIIKYYNNTK